MSNSDRARKLLVRTFLVSGSTVATIMGAQGLITLDQQTLTSTASDVATVDSTASDITIAHTEPTIVILPDDESAEPQIVASAPTIQLQQSTTQSSITAPQSSITAPQPVIIQRSVPMTSRSTR
ncbi:MAG: hypothetical protein IT320_07280 [Anaerolineae bacterium]|nr:hypothetical protein [Anaerolineae bacterium]